MKNVINSSRLELTTTEKLPLSFFAPQTLDPHDRIKKDDSGRTRKSDWISTTANDSNDSLYLPSIVVLRSDCCLVAQPIVWKMGENGKLIVQGRSAFFVGCCYRSERIRFYVNCTGYSKTDLS